MISLCMDVNCARLHVSRLCVLGVRVCVLSVHMCVLGAHACALGLCVCWVWKDVCCRQRGWSFPGEAEIRGWSQTPEKVRAQKKVFKRHRGRVRCQWRGRSLCAQRQVGRRAGCTVGLLLHRGERAQGLAAVSTDLCRRGDCIPQSLHSGWSWWWKCPDLGRMGPQTCREYQGRTW